jgi:hypothetical protein
VAKLERAAVGRRTDAVHSGQLAASLGLLLPWFLFLNLVISQLLSSLV